MYSVSFTRGGGDYCDGVYYLANGLIDARREAEFQNAQIFQVTGAGIMLALGFFIIFSLILHSRKKQNKLNIIAILGITLMMVGYTIVILMSGKGGQNC